jgi:uncharacterized protein involved in type VI secretion and phage assembly
MIDEPLAPDRPSLGSMHGLFRGKVISVQDPDRQGQVQVRLYSAPAAVADDDAGIWAHVAVPFSGGSRGAFFLPDVGDEVAVMFVQCDPTQPIVVGGLWNGADAPPEQLGGDRVDRYAIKARRGSRIAIVEERDGEAKITVSTPGQVTVALDQSSGGKLTLEAAGNEVTLDTNGITLQGTQKVSISAGRIELKASQVDVKAPMASFQFTVKAELVKATTVVATTYTPGAGNVW